VENTWRCVKKRNARMASYSLCDLVHLERDVFGLDTLAIRPAPAATDEAPYADASDNPSDNEERDHDGATSDFDGALLSMSSCTMLAPCTSLSSHDQVSRSKVPMLYRKKVSAGSFESIRDARKLT
jgi:hypothetical protein